MAEEINTLIQEIRSYANDNREISRETAKSFREEANATNETVSSVVKSLGVYFSSQKGNMDNLTQAVNENEIETEKVSRKLDTMNGLLQRTIENQNVMIMRLAYMGGTLNEMFKAELSNNQAQLNKNDSLINLFKDALIEFKTLSKILGPAALALAAYEGGKFLIDKLFQSTHTPEQNEAAGNILNKSLMGRIGDIYSDFSGKNKTRDNTSTSEEKNLTGSESKAKESAEKYYGKPISNTEWSELVRATFAESGHKNQTEMAMVMASIINRARDNNKSIHDTLYAKNQFQGVTGPDNKNFLNGPDAKNADKIFGAASNILENVSKQQKNFTAASSSAYNTPGYQNTGYRDRLLSENGSIVGGSVFNTKPPTQSSVPQEYESNRRMRQNDKLTFPPDESAEKENPNGGNDQTSIKIPLSGGAASRGYASSIGNMDPSFRDKLTKMFAAAQKEGVNLSVYSGWRSQELQDSLFNKSDRSGHMVAKNSFHTKGMAADLSGDLDWVHQNASRFGLYFPMSWEKWHVEPVGSRSGNIERNNNDNSGANPTTRGNMVNSNDNTQPRVPSMMQTITSGGNPFSQTIGGYHGGFSGKGGFSNIMKAVGGMNLFGGMMEPPQPQQMSMMVPKEPNISAPPPMPVPVKNQPKQEENIPQQATVQKSFIPSPYDQDGRNSSYDTRVEHGFNYALLHEIKILPKYLATSGIV